MSTRQLFKIGVSFLLFFIVYGCNQNSDLNEYPFAGVDNCSFPSVPTAPAGWNVTFLNSERIKGFPSDFHMVSENLGYLLMSANYTANTVVLKTIDGGVSWTSIYDASIYRRPREIFFLTADIGFISMGYEGNGHLLKTIDGGMNWEKIVLNNLKGFFRDIQIDSTGNLYAIHFKDYNTCQLVKSIDEGITWNVIFDSDLLLDSEIDTNLKIESNEIFAAGKDGNLLRINIDGKLIDSMNVDISKIQNFVIYDTKHISISSYNSVFITSNGGNTWDLIHDKANNLIDFRRTNELISIINKSCCRDYDVCYSNDAISIYNNELDTWIEGGTTQTSIEYIIAVEKISDSKYKFLTREGVYYLKED